MSDMARRALAVVDLTRLERPDDAEAIDALAAKAVTAAGAVASICVYPEWIERVLGPGVPVAAVANFPAGDDAPLLAAREAAVAVEDGAAEVDVVVPWRAFQDGDTAAIERTLAEVRGAVGDDVVLKAILETGSLRDAAAIRDAGERALGAGADFLKTSTGKVGPGASLQATEVLLGVVRSAGHGGVKASGGIRTAEQAAEYLELADRVMGAGWATPERFRLGASALVDDLHERLGDA
ncbi:MAG: deoxyribose-phosphate aldolase [Solirubrobacteraceae bacterium]|nr:deoxyribose-phosphate aldolase [Solirubrobacteraceae bacterium]